MKSFGLKSSTSIIFLFLTLTQGRIQGGSIGSIVPLKPTKVALFTMNLYNSENNIAIIGHFLVHCFVTAVLWSIFNLCYSTEAVVRLNYHGLSATKKGWNNQHPTTVNNGSKNWRIVSSYLQLSWLVSIITWHWATLCYVSHNFSPRNLAGKANIRQTDWYQW